MDRVETFYAFYLAFQELLYYILFKQMTPKQSIIESTVLGAISGVLTEIFFPQFSSSWWWWGVWFVIFLALTLAYKVASYYLSEK